MAADYTVSVVYRDGNPRDIAHFGTDLKAALRAKTDCEADKNPHHEHWMVYDSDDPERGYFSEDSEETTGGVLQASQDLLEKSERHQEILSTMCPWYEDPRRIARLLRWLEMRKKAPTTVLEIADLVENAETWIAEYELMRETEETGLLG